MADFVRSLPFLTETRYTCPVNTRDRAGKGEGGGMERGGAAQGDMPPPARGCLRSDWPCAGRAGGGRRCRPGPRQARLGQQLWSATSKAGNGVASGG